MTKHRTQQSREHRNRNEQPALWSWLNKELPPIQPLLFAFTFNIALLLLTYLVFTPQFNTRDDTAMMLLAAGKIIALEPTEYLVFTNLVIGLLLKTCYLLSSAIPWYSWYLILTLTLTHTALLYGLLRRTPSRGMLLLFLLYYVLFGAHCMVSLQFTMVSSLTAVAGMFLLSTGIQGGNTGLRRFFPAPLVAGILFFVWAYMIRVESALLMAGVLLPVIIVMGWNSGDVKQWALRLLPAFGATFMLCLVVYGYNDYHYQRWGKTDYREFNTLCREFLDVNILKRTVLTAEERNSFLKAGGWTWQDYELLQNWFFMDTTLYTPDRIRAAAREAKRIIDSPHPDPERQKEKESYQSNLQTSVLTRVWQVWTSPTALIALCCGILSVVLFTTRSRVAYLQIGGYLLATLAATYYISHQTILRDTPERVTFPLLATLALLPVLFAGSSDKNRFGRIKLRQIFAIGCFLALGIAGFRVVRDELAVSRENDKNRAAWESIVKTLNPSADALYVIWADGFPLGWISPFDALHNLRSFHALWLAWCQRTPTSFAMLQKHGVQDVYYELATNPKVSFLLSYNQNVREELRYPTRYGTFMREHYGLNVSDKGGTRFLNSVPDSDPGAAYKTFMVGKLEADNSSTATTTTRP